MFNSFVVFRPFPFVKNSPERVNQKAAWVSRRWDCLWNSCLEDRTVQVAEEEKHLQQHFYYGIYLHLYLLVLFLCVLVDLSMSSVWASLTWLCRAEKKANEKCGTCISSPVGIQVVFLIFAAKSRDSCFAHHPSQPCKSRFLSVKLFVAGLVFRRSIKNFSTCTWNDW